MSNSDPIRFYCKTLKNQLACLQKGCFRFHVPRPLRNMRRIAGTHFHFFPELFIQVGGLTDFSFPREKKRLLAGETLLVPRGLPHEEVARNSRTNFKNIVIMFPRGSIKIITTRNRQGHPQGFNREYFKTGKGGRVEQYLDDIVALEHVEGKGPRAAEADQAIRGLFQAALASLLVIIKELKTSARPIEHLKVSACRKYILNRIYDSSLSVKKLAGQLGCSPDYLSHLFVIETGERLSDFIHQERIAMAERHLQNPALSIKEVARACGFADQGYFARLFKRLAGKTPQEFRKKLPSQP